MKHEVIISQTLNDFGITLDVKASPLIRCKDCKWSYDDVSGRICSYGVCVDCAVSDDFYCADAERRTDER